MSTGRYSGILVELVRGARVAPLTAFTCFACLVVTAGAWLEGGAEPESWEHMARWGALSGPDIWEGRIWGLLTSVFVHGDPLHLVFNVYWLWTFGLVLERVLPRVALLGLLVAAGVVSSAAELAVTGDPGIGVSGVLYAWFGVLWSARRAVPSFAAALDQRTIGLFLVWLVVCIVATHLEYWNIGNAAHLGGLLFGVGVGPSFLPGRWRAQARAATVIGSAGVLVAAFWCPWNAEWTFQRAIRQHERGELEQAERSYRRSLEQGVEPERAWGALAYLAQAADDTALYDEALTQLSAVDREVATKVAAAADRRKELRSALKHERDPLEKEMLRAYLARWDWNHDEAQRILADLLAAHPEEPRVQHAYASFLLRKEDPARAELRQALALAQRAAAATDRKEDEALEILAEALYRNGDARAARETLRELEEFLRGRGERLSTDLAERATTYEAAAREE